MSTKDIAYYRNKVQRMGRWIGTRYLRNRGLSFEQTYFILFDRLPKVQYAA